MPATRRILVAAALIFSGAAALAQGRNIYSDIADAHADIAQAMRAATAGHKNIILDFGGNWCGDCQVLDIYFHQDANLPLLEQNYELVHVNVGHYNHDLGRYDRNQDVADKYDLPLKKGVPALVVLNARGGVLYVQKSGEFENMRNMNSASVTEFLNQWKPKR